MGGGEVKGFPLMKVEAAERQLRQGIRLFFGCGDEVSIHTLTCAAREVLGALATLRGIDGPVDAAIMARVRSDKVKEVSRLLREAQNFVKHADRDPEKALTFYPEATVYLLLDACILHSLLTGYHLPETHGFIFWFNTWKPDLLLEGPFKEFFTTLHFEVSTHLKGADHPEVRELWLAQIDNLRRTQGERLPLPTPGGGTA
jgi:hypothetical protein